MSRTLKTEIPGIDHRVTLEALKERGVPPGVVVEIGFGRGEFLLELAQSQPEQPFLGVEISYKRTLKMARRLARLEVGNVILHEGLAESLLREGLPTASVSCFWVNFPDPWPKKRHARRRLVQAETLTQIQRCLAPGGMLHIATDDPVYAEWIDEHLAATPGLVNRHAPDRWRPEALGRAPTAYELKWRALGRSFHFFDYSAAALEE